MKKRLLCGGLFRPSCRKLGGKPTAVGDAGFDIPLFGDLFLRLTFWDADDEFAARLMVTSDENILDFMRYETTFFAVSHVLKLLTA